MTVGERRPQVVVAEGAEWRLTLLEATGGNRIAGQMRTQHAGQLFGVAALVGDDVANGPRLTPGAGAWTV